MYRGEINTIIRPVTLQDIPVITLIYNHYIENTTATFEKESLTQEQMRKRIVKISSAYPYLVYEQNGEVLGYCYAHQWKEKAAFSYTAEVTVYLSTHHKRKGIGLDLMKE